MKIFTAKRKIIISALVLAIIILASIIAMQNLASWISGLTPASGNTPHFTQRDARVGLASNVVWENNFGGSGDDIPTHSFAANGNIYIFGQTSSTDLDLVGGGGIFIAQLSSSGATKNFAIIGSSGDTLFETILTQNGFLLSYGNESITTTMIDLSLNTVWSKLIDLPSEHSFNVCDSFYFDDNYYIVSQSTDAQTAYVVSTTINDVGEITSTTTFKRTLNMTYLAFFGLSTPTFVFHEYGTSASCLTFVELGENGNMAYFPISTSQNYNPLSIIPIQNGFAVLANEAGESYTFIISDSFALLRKVILPFNGLKSGELFYLPDTKRYYASTYNEGDLSGLFDLGEDIVLAEKLEFPAHSQMLVLPNASVSAFALYSAESAFLATLGTNSYTSDLISKDVSAPLLMRNGEEWLMIFGAKKTASAIGNNFGGYDVAICRLEF